MSFLTASTSISAQILALLTEYAGREFTCPTIAKALKTNKTGAIQKSLSDYFHQGRVLRPRLGVYMVAHEEPQPAGDGKASQPAGGGKELQPAPGGKRAPSASGKDGASPSTPGSTVRRAAVTASNGSTSITARVLALLNENGGKQYSCSTVVKALKTDKVSAVKKALNYHYQNGRLSRPQKGVYVAR